MRADARAKRDQIISAALDQISRRPLAEITLNGIAADAGVGIATLYRHFPSRTALFHACALVFIDRLDDLLSDTLTRFDDNPSDAFESYVWALVDSGVGVLAPALAAEPGSPISADVVLRRDAFFDHVQELLDRAAAHGLVGEGESPNELAAELIVATRPLSSPLAELFPDVRTRLVRHLMDGWRP